MKQDIVLLTTIIKHLTSYQQRGKTHIQWGITILVNITILNFGIQISWPACVAKVLQSDESPTGSPLTDIDISWLASCLCLAATVSIPVWTYVVDTFGRKPCMIICAGGQVTSWLITYVAANMATLVVARAVGGVATGGCIYTLPMYVKEISQDDLRGALGLVTNTYRNLGVLIIYLLGDYFEYYTILYIVLSVAIVGVLTLLKVPESPTYYVKIKQIETAGATIAYLRNLNVDDKDVQNAVDSIKAEDEKFKSIPNITFIGILKQKAWCKGFIFMILLMLCHALNGGLSVVTFAPAILDMSRVTVNPELQSLSVPVFMIIGSLLSMVFIDRLGRKPLLVSSFLLALLAFAALAAIIIVQHSGGVVPEWVSVVVIAVPVLSYAAAVSPVPFVLMSEMFNFQIRAKVMGCLVMLGWAGTFVQTLIFGTMSTACGPQVTFIFFAVVNFCGTLVALLLLPETKGKSVLQIELELENKLER